MMAVAVDAMRGDAEAAISGAAIEPAVRTRHRYHPRAAIGRPHQPHRDRAGRGASHHCQHDTARAFHGAILAARDGARLVLAKRWRMASESEWLHGNLRLSRQTRSVTRNFEQTRRSRRA